jgi:hypothetical protein
LVRPWLILPVASGRMSQGLETVTGLTD